MNLLRFVRDEFPLIGFGLLLTFFSSFGQTFLISLYLPDFLAYFDMTNGQFGTLYSIATIGSASCLLYAGKLIDRMDLLHYSLLVCAAMVISCLLVSFSTHMALLLLGIFGLRFSGQGLMSHTSMTTMGRYFVTNRGKAVSVASLGHAFGEFAFPVLITAMITGIGWRYSMMGSALMVLIILVPLMYIILRKRQEVRDPVKVSETSDGENEEVNWKYAEMLGDARFWVLVPGVFIMGFLVTALFFFQVPLAEFKGWSREWIATCIMAFAVMQVVSALLTGPMIDKYSARVIYPFHLIPLALGVCVLLTSKHELIGIVYMGLLGMSMGFGNTVKSAVFAELFGTRSLGLVRSLFTVVMVTSTALGPVVFGWLLDFDTGFEYILAVSAGVVFLIVLASFPVKGMGKRRPD